MSHYPTIRQIQYLLALAEHKNFRKAAESCFVTQPTLSSAMQELEEGLGVPLLDRSQRKKVIFTSFGLRIIEKCRQIIPLMDDLLSMAQTHAEPFSGVVRLGLIPTIAPFLLPVILRALQAELPKMEFHITEAMSAELVEKLDNSELDLAVMAFPYDVKLLKSITFYEESFICAAPSNIFSDHSRLSLNQLRKQDVLLLDDGHCLRDHALSACQLEHLPTKRALSATSLQTILQMVAQGYGVTLLPEMMLKHAVISDDVKLHHFVDPVPTRQIGAAWRENNPQITNILGVIEALKVILK